MTHVIKISTRPAPRHASSPEQKADRSSTPLHIGRYALKIVPERQEVPVDYFGTNRWNFARLLNEMGHALDETTSRTGRRLSLAKEFRPIDDEISTARQEIEALTALALADIPDVTVTDFIDSAVSKGVDPQAALRTVTQRSSTPQS